MAPFGCTTASSARSSTRTTTTRRKPRHHGCRPGREALEERAGSVALRQRRRPVNEEVGASPGAVLGEEGGLACGPAIPGVRVLDPVAVDGAGPAQLARR